MKSPYIIAGVLGRRTTIYQRRQNAVRRRSVTTLQAIAPRMASRKTGHKCVKWGISRCEWRFHGMKIRPKYLKRTLGNAMKKNFEMRPRSGGCSDVDKAR